MARKVGVVRLECSGDLDGFMVKDRWLASVMVAWV